MKISIKYLPTFLLISISLLSVSCGNSQEKKQKFDVVKTDAEWKQQLTAQQYAVLRKKGTERPYTGKYYASKGEGTYVCAACGAKLYNSTNKYDSHCGWPSFDRGVETNLLYKPDNSLGMRRTEVMCKVCGGHLGHIFNDGPRDTTGKRHCINSVSIKFIPKK